MSRPSGKFVLRVEPETHGLLREAAVREKASLNEVCNRLIQRGLKGSQPYEQVLSCAREFLDEQLPGVVLIGSQARGTATARSDVDFLVIVAPEVKIDSALYRRWERFKKDLPEQYSVHFVHSPDPERPSGIWLEAALEGQILVDLDGIGTVLQRLRCAIASGVFCRRLSHGQPYWTQNRTEKGTKERAK